MLQLIFGDGCVPGMDWLVAAEGFTIMDFHYNARKIWDYYTKTEIYIWH